MGVSEHKISGVYSTIEDSCYEFITGEKRPKVGGPRLTAEINEALLKKRKYHTGGLLGLKFVYLVVFAEKI